MSACRQPVPVPTGGSKESVGRIAKKLYSKFWGNVVNAFLHNLHLDKHSLCGCNKFDTSEIAPHE